MHDLPEFASWIRPETFEPYIGGFLEVTNPYQSYIYYGKIATITLTQDGTLAVTFEWFAAGVDRLNRRSRDREGGWVSVDKPYEAQLFSPPSHDIPDDYTRVFFKLLAQDEYMLRIFGGPIFEDLLTFYAPGTLELVTREEIRPADPERPLDEGSYYPKGPPGGSYTTLWDVLPDGRQVKK